MVKYSASKSEFIAMLMPGKMESVSERMSMLTGSNRKTIWSVNRDDAARKNRIKYFSLGSFAGSFTLLLSFLKIVASAKSRTAPIGHTQPQKNRPNRSVTPATASAGQRRLITALPARAAAPATSGSMRRKTFTAYGRISLSLYSVFRNRNTNTRKTATCENLRNTLMQIP